MAECMTSDDVIPPGAGPNHGGIRRVKATAAIGRRSPTGRPKHPNAAEWFDRAVEIGLVEAKQEFYALNPRKAGRHDWWESHVGRAYRAYRRRQSTTE